MAGRVLIAINFPCRYHPRAPSRPRARAPRAKLIGGESRNKVPPLCSCALSGYTVSL